MRRSASEPAPAPAPAPPVDSSQFGTLYEANFEQVYAFVARRVKGREEIEDLTAEVFRRALAGMRSFENRGVPFSAWLLRIATNAVIDRARRAKRKTPPPDALAALAPSEPECLDAATRARLFRAVAALPADQRRVVELRFAEERSIAQIAAELGRTEGSVKQLQLRALRGLRKRMDREDG
jgi:RNA polymerase sigma-70 factor (ECF subfamily)